MPDVQEVFRMATQQVKPDPGALERQETHQRRRSTGKKIGAFAVAAAVVVATLVLIWTLRPADRDAPANEGTSVAPTVDETAAALTAARGFFDAFAAFDAEGAMAYVADDADLSGVIDYSLPADTAGLAKMLAVLEAWDYRQTITTCGAASPIATIGDDGYDVQVDCGFAFTALAELDRGPFPGGTFTFTVHDGQIVSASLDWDTEEFSPEVWEPFAAWVSTTHPQDAAVMYADETLSNFRFSDRSSRLWHRNAQAYVKAVLNGNAE
ncbi:MAG TPA: hypothetical protein VIE12_11285 [Actinomycetota bacterium]